MKLFVETSNSLLFHIPLIWWYTAPHIKWLWFGAHLYVQTWALGALRHIYWWILLSKLLLVFFPLIFWMTSRLLFFQKGCHWFLHLLPTTHDLSVRCSQRVVCLPIHELNAPSLKKTWGAFGGDTHMVMDSTSQTFSPLHYFLSGLL